MTPQAAALVLFESALDQPVGERASWIAAQCPDDAETRNAALALLAAHARSDGFLEQPALLALPRQLGPWRLLHLLGSGGMGRVYLAERADGAFERKVAVKVLPGLLGDAAAARRATRERQFLAGLEHPNIARILDGGTSPEGQPYVVMDYVQGERIDAWCLRQRLDPGARVRVFLQVLDAVAAAHRALIVHRDLKPGNILVDDDGRVRLLDFGIAATLDEAIDGELTILRYITPRYASPEQIEGRTLTTASDLYSLGLVLHELLTGTAVRARIDTSPAGLLAAAQAGPPARPSRSVDATALALDTRAARAWRAGLSGDLDRIVLKALASQPEHRYGSAEAFAEDLRNWLALRPVRARGDSTGYRLRLLLRRNRWSAGIAALGLIGMVLGLVLALHQAHQAGQAAERARQASSFLGELIRQSDPYLNQRQPSLREAIDRAASSVGERFAGQPALESEVRLALGRAYLSLEALQPAHEQLSLALLRARGQGWRSEAEARAALGTWAWTAGELSDAEAQFQAALELIGRRSAGRALRSTVLNDYGAMLGDIGRYDEAKSLLLQAQELAESTGSGADRDGLVILGNLAGVVHGLGDLDGADRLYRQAQQALTGLPHGALDLAINLGQHAAVLNDLGQHEQAARALERSIALRSGPLGPEHPRLAVPLAMLAQVLARLGDHSGARSRIDEALQLASQLYSTQNPGLGHVHAAAARIAWTAGDHERAREQAEAALAIYALQPDAVPAARIELMRQTLDALPVLAQ